MLLYVVIENVIRMPFDNLIKASLLHKEYQVTIQTRSTQMGNSIFIIETSVLT